MGYKEFDIEKIKGFTMMPNHHLKNDKISLKAIGLYSKIISLPDDWDYSFKGLVSICKESDKAVRSAINELKEYGYIDIIEERTPEGYFKYRYNVYLSPHTQNRTTDNRTSDKDIQLSTKELSTKELNNIYMPESEINHQNDVILPSENKKKQKHRHGEFKNVLLTDEEYDRLGEEYGDDARSEFINRLDEYIGMKGSKYKDHNLVIRNWMRKDGIKPKEKPKETTLEKKDKFCNLGKEKELEFRKIGIIREDDSIDCFNATADQREELVKAGIL